jgi:hypothetical protein
MSINSLPTGSFLPLGPPPWSGIFKKNQVWILKIWKRSAFYQPEASNDTKEGRARNRRVEILIAPQLEVKGK